jgi:hypothetical protein
MARDIIHLRNREALYRRMRETNAPYWRLKVGTNTYDNPVEIADIEDSIEALDMEFNDLASNSVEVIISRKTFKEIGQGGGKGQSAAFLVNIHTNNYNKQSVGSIPTINNNSKKDEEIMLLKLELMKRDLEDDFNIRLAEIEANNNKNEGLGAIQPYLPMILSALGIASPTPKAMAGIETEEETNTTITVEANKLTPEQEIQRKKCGAACSKLLKVDPTAGDALTMLAEFATLSPDSYKSFIPILEAQLNMLKMK